MSMRWIASCCLAIGCIGVVLAEHPYKGKIASLYESIERGDIKRAETLLRQVGRSDTRQLYPVFELAECFLVAYGDGGSYQPLPAYRMVQRIVSRGEMLDEAEEFLGEYGFSIDELRLSLEEMLLQEARQERSIAGWDRFIRNVENDSMRVVADSVREEMAYALLVKEPYVDRCEAFLGRHPAGRHALAVTELKDSLEYEGIGDNVRLLKDFIERCKTSRFREAARIRLDQTYMPSLSIDEAKGMAAMYYPEYGVVEAFPYADSERGLDQWVAVVDSNEKALIVHRAGGRTLVERAVLPEEKGTSGSHVVDRVEKVVVLGEVLYLVTLRYFSYSLDCRDCVDRVYGLYDPRKCRLDEVTLSGKDIYDTTGHLSRIDADWLPHEENDRTAWLKDYAAKELSEWK